MVVVIVAVIVAMPVAVPTVAVVVSIPVVLVVPVVVVVTLLVHVGWSRGQGLRCSDPGSAFRSGFSVPNCASGWTTGGAVGSPACRGREPNGAPMSEEAPQAAIDPEAFYDEYGEEEWRRLERSFSNRMEFENSVAYIDREFPESGHVLDAGGAAGRYAAWLADRGYRVMLLDCSAGQLSIARRKLTERDVRDRVGTVRADLRSIPAPDDSFDGVLCLGGPISHVMSAKGRAQAARELRRVGAPGAPVLVSVMGRLAVLKNTVRNTPELGWLLPKIAETGDYDREAVERLEDPEFTVCHFFRADELERLLEDAGLTVETLVGLEGVATNLDQGPDAVEELDPEVREPIERVVRDPDLREDRSVADLSEHIMAVARV